LAAAPSFLLNSEHWTINMVRMLTRSAVRAHSLSSAQYCLIRQAERGCSRRTSVTRLSGWSQTSGASS
jgi:hypothetical protein